MSVQDTIATLRERLADETDLATFLESVLVATGQTLPDGAAEIIIHTYTREQITARFAHLAES